LNFQFLFDNFWTLTITGLTAGAIYALIALGYTLVYGVLRLINFAHSEIFMIGTFAAVWAVSWLGITTSQEGLALIFTLLFMGLVSMAFSGGSAVLLERLAYRPLRKRGAGRLAALISAIGASLAIAEAFGNWVDRNPVGFSEVAGGRVMDNTVVFTIFGTDVTNRQLLVIVAAIVMMIGLDQFVKRTRLGRGIRAVAQDPETATLMGVNIDRVIMYTFLIGGVMAGGAATLYMIFFESTRFSVGFLLGVKAFTAAVLGGIGNLRGALVGGLLLGLIENYGAGLFGGQWKDVVSFVVLVLVLMIRPTGILGESLGRARA
jgi:branched-chain amino acid transport system permease protein